jgi:hypothetical protein
MHVSQRRESRLHVPTKQQQLNEVLHVLSRQSTGSVRIPVRLHRLEPTDQLGDLRVQLNSQCLDWTQRRSDLQPGDWVLRSTKRVETVLLCGQLPCVRFGSNCDVYAVCGGVQVQRHNADPKLCARNDPGNHRETDSTANPNAAHHHNVRYAVNNNENSRDNDHKYNRIDRHNRGKRSHIDVDWQINTNVSGVNGNISNN